MVVAVAVVVVMVEWGERTKVVRLRLDMMVFVLEKFQCSGCFRS